MHGAAHSSRNPELDELNKLKQLEERFRDILDNTNDLIQVLAPDASFLFTNEKWRQTLGYSEEEICQLTLFDVLHPDSLTCCTERFASLKCGDSLRAIEFRFVAKDGHTIELSGDCGTLIKNGNVVATRGIFKDITEQKKAQQARTESENRYQDLFDHAPIMYFMMTQDMIIRSVNRCGARELGYTVDELIGRSVSELIHPDDADESYARASRIFAGEVEENEQEYRLIHRDGTVIWVYDRIHLAPARTGQAQELLCVCRDVTTAHKMKIQLEYQATHDALTGLINRGEFEHRLSRVLDNLRRSGGNHALCYLDLDQFKTINDSCGHLAGDEVLRRLSKLIDQHVRQRDTLARLGGDEFVILMEHCDLKHAQRACREIIESASKFEFIWDKSRFGIGISIGVVSIDQHSRGLSNILSKADSACYAAKEAGRNCVHIAH